MTRLATRHEGQWRLLPNLAANLKGSIHDDERARELGFKAGFVPGPTVAEAVMPGIIALFGEGWYEGGWFDLKFITPVYNDEEVREVLELAPDASEYMVKLETREGRVTCGGRVGLGTDASWHAELDGQRGAREAFPHMKLGRGFEPQTLTIEESDFRRVAETAGNDMAWYTQTSPWGGPIVPPCGIFRKAGSIRNSMAPGDLVDPPGINADFQLIMKRPVFVGQLYVFSGSLVDKGVSGRTWFWTCDFSVRDLEGNECALGRQKVKYFYKRTAA